MKAVRPHGTPTGAITPWLILGVAATAYGVGLLAWLGGRIATALTGGAWDTGPEFGSQFFGHLLRGQVDHLWPGVPVWLAATTTGVLLAAAVTLLAAAWWVVTSHRNRPGDPVASLATPRDVLPLTPKAVTTRALALQPSLAAAKQVEPSQTGVLLGKLQRRGPHLRASVEDALLAFMAPRSMKTTALAIPTVLAAPGPAVATSNKSDLWMATAADRATDGRSAWAFDPQQIAFTPQTWYWDAVDGVTTVEEAERLAAHFVVTVDDPQHRDIWGPGATELLSALTLAAGITGGSLRQVYDWLTDDSNQEPVTILASRPQFTAQANGLRGIMNAAWETKTGFYQTARTAARCLRDPHITAWVTPPTTGRPLRKFDPRKFVRSRDTLYLMSKDGGGGAGPLVAALVDRCIREAVRHSEALGGGLDPWMPIVLDEAANICRIADLPNLYSHLGSRRVVPVTILQSWAQGESVWGRAGMQALWSAATVKLIGAGIDDSEFAERLSRLVGDHDVTVASYSRGGRDHTLSESLSLRRQRILSPDKIRALRKGTALLLATGCRPALVTLLPWFTSPDANRIKTVIAAARKDLTARAKQRF